MVEKRAVLGHRRSISSLMLSLYLFAMFLAKVWLFHVLVSALCYNFNYVLAVVYVFTLFLVCSGPEKHLTKVFVLTKVWCFDCNDSGEGAWNHDEFIT